MDKWQLLRSRIETGMAEIDKQDRGTDPETHARYRGMIVGMQSVLDWMYMSEQDK